MDGFIEIMPPVRIASPCTNVCRIDPVTGWCQGCVRTRDEIARWTVMSDAERASVMHDLPTRRR